MNNINLFKSVFRLFVVQLLNKITDGDSEETKIVLMALECNGSDVLLIHLSNVSRRDLPCGYFSTFYDERNGASRCLAVEMEERRGSPMNCPFYSPDLESRCNYKHNKQQP